MCLAVPGKIVSIDESTPGLKMARVNFAGVMKNVCVEWLPQPHVGEYVLVHVGFALEKINEKEARETLSILREMGDLPAVETGENTE